MSRPATLPGPVLALAIALVLALVSALLVVSSTHRTRQLYAELQAFEADRWYLEEEYSRLLLEQSTWASHHRIESTASETLGLADPAMASVRVLDQ